jgi:peptidyl-prolyl cis-trans isomerase D
VVTPDEVQREFNRRNEKIKLEYIEFNPISLQSEVKSTPQELQAYFNARRGQFTMPETRTFEMIVVDPQKVAASIQVSDAQVAQYYNSHRDQFRTPERVKVRHILLSTAGKPKEEVAKIQAKAEGLLKQVKAGGDFAALAKQNSDDPGSKDNGGDLGYVVRGQTVKNFETAAFALKPNEISNLISTEYGFHIIQLLEKQDARVEPLSEAKTRIAEEAKKGSLNDRMQNVADQARAELAKAPKSAEQIATKLDLNYVKVDKHKPGDPLPAMGADKQVDDAVVSLKKGEVSPVLQAGTRLVVAELDDIVASRPAEFAEVEPKVREQFQQERAVQLTAEKAKKAMEMLKSNGGDLKAVAKSTGGEVKTADFFGRGGAAEGIGSASYFSDAFPKAVGSIVGPVNAGTKTVVAKLIEKQAPDPAKLASEREAIVGELKGKRQDERVQLFEDSVLSRLVQEGKVKIHRDVVNRILARFRS